MCSSIKSASNGQRDNRAAGEEIGDEPALLINRQRSVRADWARLRDFLGVLQLRLAKHPFAICLVSDRGIRRYNKQYRHKDQPTDVLSFPDGNGSQHSEYLGDILISVETARRNASRFRLSLEEEIKILSLHGVLHLLGYDHETDHGEMARAERLWSGRLGLRGSLGERAAARSRQSRKGARR